jgi:pimeloyl-ACP methyl ester carboxylesterase
VPGGATARLGPLAATVQGPIGGPGLILIPPNPLDGTAWALQSAHFSAWFRTVVIDLPGYGHSPRLRQSTTMEELAESIWEVAATLGLDSAVVGGVSIGSALALHLARLVPTRIRAVVLSGASYSPDKSFAGRRIAGYRERGLGYRRQHLRDGHSAAFRRTRLGRYFALVASDRDHLVDPESIVRLFEAYQAPDPEDLYRPACPTLIIAGSRDYALSRARDLHAQIPGSEFSIIRGAGHACNLEQAEQWDAIALDFIARRLGMPKQP